MKIPFQILRSPFNEPLWFSGEIKQEKNTFVMLLFFCRTLLNVKCDFAPLSFRRCATRVFVLWKWWALEDWLTALFPPAFSIDEPLVVRGLDVNTDEICLLFGSWEPVELQIFSKNAHKTKLPIWSAVLYMQGNSLIHLTPLLSSSKLNPVFLSLNIYAVISVIKEIQGEKVDFLVSNLNLCSHNLWCFCCRYILRMNWNKRVNMKIAAVIALAVQCSKCVLVSFHPAILRCRDGSTLESTPTDFTTILALLEVRNFSLQSARSPLQKRDMLMCIITATPISGTANTAASRIPQLPNLFYMISCNVCRGLMK